MSYSKNLNIAIKRNLIQMVLIRGLTIIVGLVLVPLTISYITVKEYGFWLTVSSAVSWLAFFDIGLGHGLRNNLTVALANKDYDKAKRLISTAYMLLISISLAIFIIGTIVIPLINWNVLLNIKGIEIETVNLSIYIIVSGFCLQFVLNIINSVLLAAHRASESSLLNFIAQLVLLICIFILKEFSHPDIVKLTIFSTAIPIVVSILYTLYFFLYSERSIKPNLFIFEKASLKKIFGLGIGFFLIQIGTLVLYQTDNFIISKLFGAEAVTEFNIAFKLFSLITMLNFIFVTPYWSAFTDAWSRKDYLWMQKNMKMLRLIWLVFTAAAFFIYILSQDLIKLWVGDAVDVPDNLLFSLMIYAIAITFQATHNYVINGIGKIKLQVVLMIFASVLNIPLSFYLGKIYGSSGVVYANVFFISMLGIAFYFQTNLLIFKRLIA